MRSVTGSIPATNTGTVAAASTAVASSARIRAPLAARSASNQLGWVYAEHVYWASTRLITAHESSPSTRARAVR